MGSGLVTPHSSLLSPVILIWTELCDRKDLNHILSWPWPGPDIKYLSITIKLDSTFLNGHCFLIKVKSETFSGKKYAEGIQAGADRLSPAQQIISLVFVMIHPPPDIVRPSPHLLVTRQAGGIKTSNVATEQMFCQS